MQSTYQCWLCQWMTTLSSQSRLYIGSDMNLQNMRLVIGTSRKSIFIRILDSSSCCASVDSRSLECVRLLQWQGQVRNSPILTLTCTLFQPIHCVRVMYYLSPIERLLATDMVGRAWWLLEDAIAMATAFWEDEVYIYIYVCVVMNLFPGLGIITAFGSI